MSEAGTLCFLRFTHRGTAGFGTLETDTIAIHQGDMFAGSTATGETLALSAVTLLTPTVPGKMIALWNNFHALAEKQGNPKPDEPLYFIKTGNSFLASGGAIRRPGSYDGRIVYEGELGIVIGKTCKEIAEADAEACIFGYSCINDVTALDLIDRDPSFAQWARAKSFDSFGAYGPVVATGLNPDELVITTMLNGRERQNYPVSDMIHPPRRLVSLISHELTLLPGDVICCGTSLGAGPMKRPSNLIEVSIDGIGTLSNTFDQ